MKKIRNFIYDLFRNSSKKIIYNEKEAIEIIDKERCKLTEKIQGIEGENYKFGYVHKSFSLSTIENAKVTDNPNEIIGYIIRNFPDSEGIYKTKNIEKSLEHRIVLEKGEKSNKQKFQVRFFTKESKLNQNPDY